MADASGRLGALTGEGASASTTENGLARRRPRGLDPEDRRRVMDALALRSTSGWSASFTLMMALSVTVAVMGLSSGSAAVVIGAMLLAPLMTPVMGTAAALAMALPHRLWRSLAVVAAASVASVGLAYALALFLPHGPLSGEVLSRTSPDLRDLVVALAAGAAGAYATIRPNVSSSLPGVAVAVALVPPLATIGITLQAQEHSLAKGAVLLYVANLAAILLVSTLVFLVTGFVPARRIQQRRGRVILGSVVATAATVGIAIPLTTASIDAAHAGRRREEVRGEVVDWLHGSGDEVESIGIDGDLTTITVSGPNPPPATIELERAVQQTLGAAAVVEVRWTQTQRSTTSGADVAETLTKQQAAARTAAVAKVVDAWLASDPTSFDIDRLTVDANEVRVDLTSTNPPPLVDDLASRLKDQLGITVPVLVNWTQRTTLHPGDTQAGLDTIEETRQRLQQAADDWASKRPQVVVSDVVFDGERVTIDLAGSEPGDAAGLETALQEVVGRQTPIDIWFSFRIQVAPSASTTTTTAP